MTREAREIRCPENVLGWIPWYADGGLSARQKGQVEAHAAECSDCRAELDIVSGAPFEIDIELPDPDRLFGEITHRIEAGERDAPPAVNAVASIAAKPGLADAELDRIGQWVFDPSTDSSDPGEEEEASMASSRSPRFTNGLWGSERIGLFAAAAALAIFFLGAVGGAMLSPLGVSPDSSRPSRLLGSENTIYHSAAVSSEAVVAERSLPMLDVVFLDSVSLRDVSKALQAVDVEIVSGPTTLGVYRVRLKRGTEDGRRPTAADVAAVANRLKASGSAVAIFAEAVP